MRALLLLCALALYGQSTADPVQVLAAARARIRGTMKRLPKYACVQTVERSYYSPPKPVHSASPCSAAAGGTRLRLDATDRLRLDVAQGAEREIHSWPGASRFDLTEIDQIVDNGPFGTGSFGGYLLDIFDNAATQFDYRGETMRDGKRLLVYAYSVALGGSHYEIRTFSSWTATAYGGTAEVDPESLEVERVTLQTPPLAAETGLCEARSTLDYQRVAIGDGTFLLPRASQLHLVQRDGKETDNSTVFSGCREYQAHSTVSFSAPAGVAAKPAETVAPPIAATPRRYDVDLRLNDTIDSETSAAGDPVTAAVVHDVHPYKSLEIVIPAGAVAHGRVSRVEHRYLPYPYVAIAISFQTLEMNGRTVPFDARPELSTPVITYDTGSGSTAQEQRVWGISPPMMPQVRIPIGAPHSFVYAYEKRHVIPAGTVQIWMTLFPPAPK